MSDLDRLRVHALGGPPGSESLPKSLTQSPPPHTAPPPDDDHETIVVEHPEHEGDDIEIHLDDDGIPEVIITGDD